MEQFIDNVVDSPNMDTFKARLDNKEAIWLYAELFLGHHDGSCHGLW